MHLTVGDSDLGRFLPDVLSDAGVTAVQISTFEKEPSFHGDTASERAREITSAARAEHLERGFGFWEYALRQAIDADESTRQYLLGGALRHASGDEGLQRLTISDFAEALRNGNYEGLPERTIVSLTSLVETSDSGAEERHLPMLDLAARSTEGGKQAVVEALRALGLRGIIFTSGRSYHFYGAQTLSKEAAVKTLGRAQLLSPIVDARWIAHQLMDGRCGLRISTDLERHIEPHRFVAHVD